MGGHGVEAKCDILWRRDEKVLFGKKRDSEGFGGKLIIWLQIEYLVV